MAYKVFLGVGHGGTDTGAVADGYREKDMTLVMALACQEELARHGVLVKLSRTKDENDPVNEEVRECNAYAPDLALDIHVNAGGGDGFEAYHTLSGGKGKTLAQNIEAEVKVLGQNSRGCKTRTGSSGRDYYAFIRDTACPAVIAEIGFIDNAKDRAAFDTAQEQQAFGRAYARGILATLGIAARPETPIASEDAEAMIAAQTIKQKAGLEDQTIRYLLNYQYGEALVKKLAKAME